MLRYSGRLASRHKECGTACTGKSVCELRFTASAYSHSKIGDNNDMSEARKPDSNQRTGRAMLLFARVGGLALLTL